MPQQWCTHGTHMDVNTGPDMELSRRNRKDQAYVTMTSHVFAQPARCLLFSSASVKLELGAQRVKGSLGCFLNLEKAATLKSNSTSQAGAGLDTRTERETSEAARPELTVLSVTVEVKA